jgi:hypothetical protein
VVTVPFLTIEVAGSVEDAHLEVKVVLP